MNRERKIINKIRQLLAATDLDWTEEQVLLNAQDFVDEAWRHNWHPDALEDLWIQFERFLEACERANRI